MSEARFTLGQEGKRVLEQIGFAEIELERMPPKQWPHFEAVNDIRIASELTLPLEYFLAHWQLSNLDWPHGIIPDAVFSTGGRTFAVEFDRGTETLRFFLKTKVAAYRRGLQGLPLAAVLVITDRNARMKALARAIGDEQGLFLYSTIELVRDNGGFVGPVFFQAVNGQAVSLVEKCCLQVL